MSISFSNSMQVTISLLPASLSLVHIPRSRLPLLSHPVLSQILQLNPTFLNITCNEVELSLFAEHHMLADFEPIARRDRLRQRSRSGSDSWNRSNPSSHTEPVEISYEKWNVLQIDSHSDQLDNSGARVRELSAPLAAAGISILYQSSYMSDFIFVRESRLKDVMSLLASAGFDLYSSDTNRLISQLISPQNSPSIPDISVTGVSNEFVMACNEGDTDTSSQSMPPSLQKLQKSPASNTRRMSPVSEKTIPATRSKSHSPTSGEVRVLSSDLTCVGLSNDEVENWGLKIIKLVAFPELIPVPTSQNAPQKHDFDGPESPMFEHPSAHVRGREVAVWDSSSSASDEDGYFSHSPDGNRSSSPLVTSSSSSSPAISKSTICLTRSFKQPSKHVLPPLSKPSLSRMDTSPHSKEDDNHESRWRVPFFSFTRTSEGSSLTTDVSLLAALFPPNERHMVICGGELDAIDIRDADPSYVESSDDEEDDCSQGRTLKCLQIDLRRFGLDKHGLVNRFSRVLEDNGINHMYSSTFKTANLLVNARHASHAQTLLRAC